MKQHTHGSRRAASEQAPSAKHEKDKTKRAKRLAGKERDRERDLMRSMRGFGRLSWA